MLYRSVTYDEELKIQDLEGIVGEKTISYNCHVYQYNHSFDSCFHHMSFQLIDISLHCGFLKLFHKPSSSTHSLTIHIVSE